MKIKLLNNHNNLLLKQKTTVIVTTACLIASAAPILPSNAMEPEDGLIPNKCVKVAHGKKATRIVTGLFYQIRNEKSGKVLSVHKKGKVQAIIDKGAPASHSQFSLVSSEEDYYKIINKDSGEELNVHDADKHQHTHKVNTFPENKDFTSHRQFSLEHLKDNHFFITNKKSNKKLNVTDADHKDENVLDVHAFPENIKYNSHRLFKFEPVAYTLKVLIEDFEYHPPFQDLKSLAGEVSTVLWTMENESNDLPITVHASEKASKENENYWSFSESHERKFFNRLNVGVSAKFFGIRGRASNTTSWTKIDKTLEETMKRTIDTTEVSLNSDIPIPPRTKATYLVTWKEVDIEIPFTATVTVRGLADRMNHDGSTAQMVPVDGEGLLSLLRYEGYTGVLSQDGKTARAQIKGTLKAKGAIDGKLKFSSTPI